MAEKIVLARVVGKGGVYINSVLLLPGELVRVNLDELGVESLDEVKSLEEVSEGDGDGIATAPIASIGPRAPGATAPQGAPPGTRQSGSGRLLMPGGPGSNAQAIEPVPDLIASELEPEAPIRRDSDVQPIEDAGDEEVTDENPEITALIRGNSKAQLIDLAKEEGVANVSEDNNKAELAAKIVAQRAAQ